jgi:citrate synthase
MLTATEAAARLGVKLGTLYAYVSRGWLKSYKRKVGRQTLYRRADIEALRGVTMPERGRRARSLPDASSWVTIAQPRAEGPPSGVIVAESAVSSIVDGQLAYRGFPIEELVTSATFEEVCWLLWSGEPADAAQAAALRQRLSGAELPGAVAAALAAVRRDAPPLLRLAIMMPALAACAPAMVIDRSALGQLDQAAAIIGLMPQVIAGGTSGDSRSLADGIAERLLRLTFGEVDRADRVVLDQVLVACAEHELNASTFAARVVASTGADLYACVLAALCSLSGPIHGGACDRIERMFGELADGAKLSAMLAEFANKQLLPPGFGHAIYRDGDPRAVLLKQVAAEMARRKGRRIFETARKIEEAVARRQGLRPNLDFYLTVCVRMLGLPPGSPAAVFALGRAAGWIAHSLEQYADNRLIRPRMRYRGSPLRHWHRSGAANGSNSRKLDETPS